MSLLVVTVEPYRDSHDLLMNLHPTSMIRTEHIFSLLVLGETFPNPTDVNDEKVKYSAVTYLKI